MIGQSFGRLTIVGSGPKRGQYWTWHCRCDCGNETDVRIAYLRSGNTSSCGCLRRELSAKRTADRARHGHAAGVKGTRTYSSWRSMRMRCLNRNANTYPKYGGAGITICERWAIFENFLADMGERPDGTSLDRIDGTKGYEPGNCRWATPIVQANNTSHAVVLEWEGKRQTLAMWAREKGLPLVQLHRRLSRGWSPERTLNEPLRPKMPNGSRRARSPQPVKTAR